MNKHDPMNEDCTCDDCMGRASADAPKPSAHNAPLSPSEIRYYNISLRLAEALRRYLKMRTEHQRELADDHARPLLQDYTRIRRQEAVKRTAQYKKASMIPRTRGKMKPRDKLAKMLLALGWHVQSFSIAGGHWRTQDVYRWQAWVSRVPKPLRGELVEIYCWHPMTLAARFGIDLKLDGCAFQAIEALVKFPEDTSPASWYRNKRKVAR